MMNLQAARHETIRLRIVLVNGRDPRIVRRIEKAGVYKRENELLETLFMDWYEKVCVKRKPQHSQILRSFQLHVFPEFGRWPADDVTLQHWLTLLERLAGEIPHIAIRILTNAKQMLKWSVRRERLSKNPLANISPAEDLYIQKNIGTRSFNNEELVRVWNGIDGCFLSPRNKIFLKLCAVYGARYTELRKARKSHFDLETKVWTVPPENHKTGKKTKRPLLRPITPEIEPLIRMAFFWAGDSEYLFPVKGTNRMRKTNSQLNLPYSIMRWLKKQNYVMEHWSIKAFRKTARTNFSTLTLPHVAEIMLGHRLPGDWQVYDHHAYLEEQAAAYSAWCGRIMKLVGTESLLGFRPPRAIFN